MKGQTGPTTAVCYIKANIWRNIFCNCTFVLFIRHIVHKAEDVLKKTLLIPVLLFICNTVFAQVVDSIYFNLYTDSLKKGTYNYINVIGKLSNGNFRPMDSTQLIFTSSYGKFYGNSLWLPFEPTVEKVNITVKTRKSPSQILHRTIYIKKKADDEKLKTVDEILADPPKRGKRRKN